MTEEQEQLLRKVGICTTCLQPYEHDLEEPFAYCKCGTSEWAFQEITKEPVLIQLQFERYVAAGGTPP